MTELGSRNAVLRIKLDCAGPFRFLSTPGFPFPSLRILLNNSVELGCCTATKMQHGNGRVSRLVLFLEIPVQPNLCFFQSHAAWHLQSSSRYINMRPCCLTSTMYLAEDSAFWMLQRMLSLDRGECRVRLCQEQVKSSIKASAFEGQLAGVTTFCTML